RYDNQKEVMFIPTDGPKVPTYRYFKLTFSQYQAIEAVSNQVVNVDIPSITFSDIGIYCPNTYVPKKLHTINPIKNQGNSTEVSEELLSLFLRFIIAMKIKQRGTSKKTRPNLLSNAIAKPFSPAGAPANATCATSCKLVPDQIPY